ncbi:MAG: dihydroorotase [Psychrilyobacter sp.]|nr:dihydroorotase [Psychrilyobacter sp.]
MINEITIIKPDDFHLHIRDFPDAEKYINDSSIWFSRALVMPNTLPPIDTPEKMIAYKKQIEASNEKIEPLMSFKILSSLKSVDIINFKKAGALIGKLYPKGVTTNSSDGIENLRELYPIFAAMENQKITLSIHGEDPSVSLFQREKAFIPKLEQLTKDFPNLKIVLEHISTIEGVAFILSSSDNVAATITAHHLLFSVDDLMGGPFNPHLFCKPIIQTVEDRGVLRAAAVSGNPKFFFGSDSAPHIKSKKECSTSAAGIYSAPLAIPVVVEIFDNYGKINQLENFLSGFGADFYGLSRNSDKITIKRKKWKVPSEYHGVVPMLANRELNWSLKK